LAFLEHFRGRVGAMSWDSTARLLRRTGFGADGAAVDRASRIAPAEQVAPMLAARPEDDPGARRTPATCGPW
jgi:hypothetical protein